MPDPSLVSESLSSTSATHSNTRPPRHDHDLITLWGLRLLWHGRAWEALSSAFPRRMHDDLAWLIDLSGRDLKPGHESALQRSVSAKLRRFEGRERVDWPQPLGANVTALAERVGLNATERELLGFFCLARSSDVLAQAVEAAIECSGLSPLRVIALALNRPPEVVFTALGPDARLYTSGLLRRGGGGHRGSGVFRPRGAAPSPDIALLEDLDQALLNSEDEIERVFDRFFRRRTPSPDERVVFAHCADEVARMRALLRHALTTGERGVNVLLHGRPGVGKTEMAHVLAQELAVELVEVVAEQLHGDPLPGDQRLRACRLCQALLTEDRSALVLVDEIEDLFERPMFRTRETTGAGKAWFNQLLESNGIPTIWIANNLQQVDRSHLRRFDYVLELEAPPPSHTQVLLARELEGLPVSSDWIDRQARQPDFTPAQVAQLGRLARRLHRSLGDETLESALSDQLARQRTLQGSQRADQITPAKPATDFRIECLNIDADPAALVAGLARQERGTLLLYGPPGTGKTAFAQHIAERLGKPLHNETASDLLNCFVGGTEKNLRGMFHRAQRDGAVLFLDEADSFLRSREGARQRWEVSQVNELLVQMERFDGIFLCATNLEDILDAASFRRFDLRIGFTCSTATQRWTLFRDLLGRIGLPAPRGRHARDLRREIDHLDGLVPGDFAAVARHYRLCPPAQGSSRQVVQCLAGELRWRSGDTRMRPGFV